MRRRDDERTIKMSTMTRVAARELQSHGQGRTQGGTKGFIPRNYQKLDLTTGVEYVANLVAKCQYVVVNVQQCSLLHGCAIPA